MNRLGITPREFYMMTPLEFHYAMKDYKFTQFSPMQRICEMLRLVAVKIHNTAFGIEKKDMINRPEQLIKFPWEEGPKVATVEEMRSKILGLSHMKGVTVKQHGEEVDFLDVGKEEDNGG